MSEQHAPYVICPLCGGTGSVAPQTAAWNQRAGVQAWREGYRLGDRHGYDYGYNDGIADGRKETQDDLVMLRSEIAKLEAENGELQGLLLAREQTDYERAQRLAALEALWKICREMTAQSPYRERAGLTDTKQTLQRRLALIAAAVAKCDEAAKEASNEHTDEVRSL